MSVILLNPNQELLFAQLQKQVCRRLISEGFQCVPDFPLHIHCHQLEQDSKISDIQISNILVENSKKVIVDFSISIGEKIHSGEMILAVLMDCRENISALPDFSENLGEIKASVKKISPFKLCEMQIERTRNSTKWAVLKEKWIKL